MSLMKRLKGDAYLGYRAVIAHPLRKLFSRDQRTGKQRFLDNYATEGLVPTSDEDRTVLLAASRCIHCGLCDLAVGTGGPSGYSGMSLLAIADTRMTSDAPMVASRLAFAKPAELSAGEAVCPTRVPLQALAAYVRRKADEVAKAVAS